MVVIYLIQVVLCVWSGIITSQDHEREHVLVAILVFVSGLIATTTLFFGEFYHIVLNFLAWLFVAYVTSEIANVVSEMRDED